MVFMIDVTNDHSIPENYCHGIANKKRVVPDAANTDVFPSSFVVRSAKMKRGNSRRSSATPNLSLPLWQSSWDFRYVCRC